MASCEQQVAKQWQLLFMFDSVPALAVYMTCSGDRVLHMPNTTHVHHTCKLM